MAGKPARSVRAVAAVEKSNRMYGGACISVGRIPSESLICSSGLSASSGTVAHRHTGERRMRGAGALHFAAPPLAC